MLRRRFAFRLTVNIICYVINKKLFLFIIVNRKCKLIPIRKMILYKRWVLSLAIMTCSYSMLAQQSWHEVVWKENTIENKNPLSPKSWISKNVASFDRKNTGVGLLLKYDNDLVNVIQSLLTDSEYPYIGFNPVLGDKIGITFLPDLLGDSVVLMRNGNEEGRFAITQGDSLQLWLREGLTELNVGSQHEIFDSFGGSYASRRNHIRATYSDFLSPVKVYMTTEACPEVNPLITVNGKLSNTNEWDVCGERDVYIKVFEIDQIRWLSEYVICDGCLQTSVKALPEGQTVIPYIGFNNGCELDTVFGTLYLNKYVFKSVLPASVVVCDDEQEIVNISGVEEVVWLNKEGLNLSCLNCTSVEISASNDNMLSGEVNIGGGCKHNIAIPVYVAATPVANHEQEEYVDEKGRVVISLVSNSNLTHKVSWLDSLGNVLGVDQKINIVRYRKNIIHKVSSAICGVDEELINLNYPAITPLRFEINYLDSVTVQYTAQPYQCSDCAVLWDFGDGQQSALQQGSYVFQQPGEYLITLTVTDRLGRFVVREKQINIY